MTELSYIPWQNAYHFVQKVQLGTENKYYNFAADYNTRDDSWYVTLYTYEDDLIFSYRKMILNVDLLASCKSVLKPACKLIPLADSDFVKRINDDVMFESDVRLYYVV